MVHRYYYIALLLICATAYLPGLGGPLIFDSLPALTGNDALNASGSEASHWFAVAGSSTTGPLGRPVSMVSFAFNQFTLDADHVFFLKLTNLVIHLLCGLVMVQLGRSLLRTRLLPAHWDHKDAEWLVLLATAFWLLHPLNVSTVLYTVQRMAQLSALFTLLSLLVYCRFRVLATGETGLRCQWHRFLQGLSLAILLAGAAAFSKENGLLALWLLIVVELCCYCGQRPLNLPRHRQVLTALAWAPVFVLVGMALQPPAWLAEGFATREFSLAERVLTQARVLWHYLLWQFWPDLTFLGLYHDDIPISRGVFSPPSALLAVLGWVVVIALILALRVRAPLLAFGAAWFGISHAMESSIFPLEMVYEHRNYLAGMAPCALVAAVLVNFGKSSPRVAAGAGLAAVALLGALLGARATLWGDELQMTRAQLENHPGSARTLYHYAVARYRAGVGEGGEVLDRDHLIDSRAAYEVMVAQDPGNLAGVAALLWLDSIYFDGADPARWLAVLRRSIASRHLVASDYNSLDALSRCAAYQGCALSPAEFLDQLRALHHRYPDSADVVAATARFYREGMNDPATAASLARQALSEQRADAGIHRELIAALVATGDHGAALEAMREYKRSADSIHQLNELRAMFAERTAQ